MILSKETCSLCLHQGMVMKSWASDFLEATCTEARPATPFSPGRVWVCLQKCSLWKFLVWWVLLPRPDGSREP